MGVNEMYAYVVELSRNGIGYGQNFILIKNIWFLFAFFHCLFYHQ